MVTGIYYLYERGVASLRIHVVRPGESLFSIARQYGVTSQKVISDNELENPNQLVIGQTLVILEGTRRHTVSPGESLYYIALQYGLSMNQILAANPQITNADIIFAGQVIDIPPRTINFGPIEVNGYAFPGINREVLGKTLPYLTYLSIFSYQVNADGSLNTIPDEPLIQAARAAGTAPLLVVTNSRFNSDIAHAVLTNDTAQNNLVNNITVP